MNLIKYINRFYFKGLLIALAIGLIISFLVTKYSVDFIYNKELYIEKDMFFFQVYKNVLLIIVIIFLLLFLTIIMISKKELKKIWKPFHDTIFELQSYNIKKTDGLNLLSSDVLEFKKLNEVLTTTTRQIEKDYRLLKEYTENVSHEIQTPLAIIKNKIELLLQDQSLDKEHLLTLAKLHQSTGRLSKLSKNLAVLTKIENNQFVKNSEVYLSDFTKERLEDFEELINLKEIQLETFFEDNPKLYINTTLAYLLFNNLISNAVKHNIKKGKIVIKITDNKFTITNTGNPLKTSKIELFNRFTKSTSSSESTGLGLSMVKKIISFYGFFISYTFEKDMHSVSIVFINKHRLNH